MLARNIELLGRTGRRDALSALVRLVNHPDERVRAWAVLALREDGNAEQWADAIARFNDPREDPEPTLEAADTRNRTGTHRGGREVHSAARETPFRGALKWAVAQVGEAFPAEEIQEDLERLKGRLSPNWRQSAKTAPAGASARTRRGTHAGTREGVDRRPDAGNLVVGAGAGREDVPRADLEPRPRKALEATRAAARSGRAAGASGDEPRAPTATRTGWAGGVAARRVRALRVTGGRLRAGGRAGGEPLLLGAELRDAHAVHDAALAQ